MKKVFSFLAALIGLSFLFSGCGPTKLSPAVQKTFDEKRTLYTTRNMHYNIGRRGEKVSLTTNYQVGFLIPVNSEVTMHDVNRKQIAFMYQGNKIILRNIPKYTGLSISKVAEKYFSSKKVDLSKFSKSVQKSIRLGDVSNGMSKKAVEISLGTPPSHVTPSLESNQWKYWKSRWSTFFVTFKNGKVVENIKAQNRPRGFSVQVN